MYLTLLLYLFLGIFFFIFPKTSMPDSHQLNIERMVKEDCKNKKTKCIDTCDFLCTEPSFKCIRNICQLQTTQSIDCDQSLGGVVVLTEFKNIPYWECVCTDPSYYGGKNCKTKAPDVCKDGVFLYKGLNQHLCKCKKGDVLFFYNGKEYCVSETIPNFF